jgi:hypothetical protein
VGWSRLRLARSSTGALAGVVRVVVVGSGGSMKRTERTEGLKERTWVVHEEPRTQTTGAKLIAFQAVNG